MDRHKDRSAISITRHVLHSSSMHDKKATSNISAPKKYLKYQKVNEKKCNGENV